MPFTTNSFLLKFLNFITLHIYATFVEGDPKSPFLIATTPRCRGGHYSFPWIAPLCPWPVPYNAEAASRTIFWVFGMTRLGIEPRSPGPLANEPDIGLMVRVFANAPGDLGSIPGRVIPKTQEMVLDVILLNTRHYKVRIKVKQSNPGKGVAPFPTYWCSSCRKGSLWVKLN